MAPSTSQQDFFFFFKESTTQFSHHRLYINSTIGWNYTFSQHRWAGLSLRPLCPCWNTQHISIVESTISKNWGQNKQVACVCENGLIKWSSHCLEELVEAQPSPSLHFNLSFGFYLFFFFFKTPSALDQRTLNVLIHCQFLSCFPAPTR